MSKLTICRNPHDLVGKSFVPRWAEIVVVFHAEGKEPELINPKRLVEAQGGSAAPIEGWIKRIDDPVQILPPVNGRVTGLHVKQEFGKVHIPRSIRTNCGGCVNQFKNLYANRNMQKVVSREIAGETQTFETNRDWWDVDVYLNHNNRLTIYSETELEVCKLHAETETGLKYSQ